MSDLTELKFLYSPENTWSNQKTWDLICSGQTIGCFQIESGLCQKFAKLLKPRCIEDLSALIALVRPGTLEAIDEETGESMAVVLCKRKNGELPITYLTNKLESILRTTWGTILYQEDAIAIAKELANFSLAEADTLRKGLGKKLPEVISKLRKEFIEKSSSNLTKEEAESIFDWIEKGQRYSFNKCVSGSTIIRRPGTGGRIDGNGYTVEHMYKLRNDLEYAKEHGQTVLRRKWKRIGSYGKGLSLCEDGKVRPNNILDIQPAGIRKTFRLTLANGAYIDVTDNHKFPTENGIKLLSNLKVGEELYILGEVDLTHHKRYGWSNITQKEMWERKIDHDHETRGFMSGENNPGYTNGGYTEFIENCKKLPNHCQICGKTHHRLEVHHINGDRTVNIVENLKRLCPSCHKKEEYKAGRTKWYEKGRSSELCKIKSIEFLKEEMTYNVEMATPNHNFVTGTGIVTCNSHSVAYAQLAYITAYLKANHTTKFLKACLANAQEGADKYVETEILVNDVRNFGIKVKKPDLRDLRPNFWCKGNEIHFGLCNIKGVGRPSITKQLEKWKVYGKKIDELTWPQLAILGAKKVIQGLICAGALDYFKLSRKQMLFEFSIVEQLNDSEIEKIVENDLAGGTILETIERLAQQIRSGKTKKDGGLPATALKRLEKIKSLVQILKDTPFSNIDSPAYTASKEKELLGINLSCSMVDEYDISDANTKCKDLNAGKTGNIILAAQIEDIRQYPVKSGKNKGKNMAFLKLLDVTGKADAAVFTEALEKYKNVLFEGNTLMFRGNRKDSSKGFIVESCHQLVK